MPNSTPKPRSANGKKVARLYHLDVNTVRKLDALATLCGGHAAAVSYAIDATYTAAGKALNGLKVDPPGSRKTR